MKHFSLVVKPASVISLLIVAGSLWLFPGDAARAQTGPAPTPRPGGLSASFPLSIDANGLMNRLAGPDGEQLADELVRLHLSFVRFEFKATDPTNLRWYDRAIGRLQSRGIRQLAVLVDPWATCHSDMRQRDPELFSRWVREVYLKGCGLDKPGESVHQLGFDELTGRYPFIQHWQIWNEPNVCGFLKSDLDACGYGLWRRDMPGGDREGVRWGMQKFGALLATVYAERANKQVQIVTGGILNAYNCSPEFDRVCNTDSHPGPENCYKLLPWTSFGCDAGTNLLVNSEAVQRYKRDNGRYPFDILGLHPYQHSAWADGYVPPALYVTQDIARNVRRFVDSTYPIWITEWSFDLASNTNQPASCRFPVAAATRQGCEENIAALLESAITGLNTRAALNITHLFWFNFSDGDDLLQAGLIDQYNRKRPAWYAFEAAAKRLGQASQQNFRTEILIGLLQRAALVLTGPGGGVALPPPLPTVPPPDPDPAPKGDFMQQLYDLLAPLVQ